MNIIIDQGNSVVKIALFEGTALLKSFQGGVLTHEMLLTLINEFHPQKGILCTVKSLPADLYSFIEESFPFFYELNNRLPLPITIDYKTPQTLGMDRIAAAVGASIQKPNTNLLIIDVGTAITIDFVTADGIYKGGNISPGIDLRFKSLYYFTDRLPRVSLKGDIPFLGYDTETAVRSGIVTGIIHELDSYIGEYKKNQNVFAFLTGGHAFYFESKLKNAIFADENLVLKGLNEILNYQQK
jgi:type III pantothenate kinase